MNKNRLALGVCDIYQSPYSLFFWNIQIALYDIWFSNFISGRITNSRFYLSHCSDMLRFLLVYKFGGVYFDQDIISLKRIPDDLENFLVEERWDMFASAVFGMNKGHPVLRTTLKLMVSIVYSGYSNQFTNMFKKIVSDL